MQPDIKRGLVLGILVLAVLIVLWSHYQGEANPSAIDMNNDTPLPADARTTSEPVVPSRQQWNLEAIGTTVRAESPIGTVVAAETQTTPTRPTATPAPAQRQTPTRRRTPAGNRYHVSKRDDTLWTIAEKYYGKGSKWRLIHRANKSILPDPNVLPPNKRLVIPPDTTVPTRVAAATRSKALNAASQKTHVVVAGETLSTIAKKYYGGEKHWKLLFKANHDRVPDPKKLPIGTVLVLPPAS